MSRILGLAFSATILGIAPVAAQDFTLFPVSGEATLTPGFVSMSIDMVAGGDIDASPLGDFCYGMIADAPDYRIQFTAGAAAFMIAAYSQTDTTLVINDPNGAWHCNDDAFESLDPAITFDAPLSGQYDIWVGTFGGGTAEAVLEFVELEDEAVPATPGKPGQPEPAPTPEPEPAPAPAPNPGKPGAAPEPEPAPAPAPPAADMPDFTLAPTFGEVSLTNGFVPDPYSFDLVAGGDINMFDVVPGCAGWVAAAPDYSLNYAAGGFPLFISAFADADLTLVINGPDGEWYCDDDSAGNLNPQVSFVVPDSGRYDIWVGTFGRGTADATLNISEIDGGGPEPMPAGTMPDPTLAAAFGEMFLAAGFENDPRTVDILAGGDIDASAIPGCVGFIATAPDYRLTYQSGSFPLYFSIDADADTTLVINGPDGQWYCDDDSAGSLNPEVAFDSPQSGTYEIWVGTYSPSTADTVLSISELSP